MSKDNSIIIQTKYGIFSISNKIEKGNKKFKKDITLSDISIREQRLYVNMNKGYYINNMGKEMMDLYFFLQGIERKIIYDEVTQKHIDDSIDICIIYDEVTQKYIKEKLEEISYIYIETYALLKRKANKHLRGWREVWHHLSSYEHRSKMKNVYDELIVLMKLKDNETLYNFNIGTQHLEKYSNNKNVKYKTNEYKDLTQNNDAKSLKYEDSYQINNEKKDDLPKEEIITSNITRDTSAKNTKEDKPKLKNKKHNDNNKSSIELIQNDLLEAKAKHQGEVEEIEKLLEPSVVSDINAYIKKVQEEYEYNIKNAPTTVTTHIVNRKVKIGRKETKWFLEQQYKGYCQICGFTFTKRGKNGGKYFELFDWFSQKITGQKVNIVQSGSSLCLCARCHSGVKYGSFKAKLVDILQELDVKNMSFDEFVSKIAVTVDNREIPECYDFIENDMYKVDIRLFNKEEFIFYTEEHFMNLFVMLRSGGE